MEEVRGDPANKAESKSGKEKAPDAKTASGA